MWTGCGASFSDADLLAPPPHCLDGQSPLQPSSKGVYALRSRRSGRHPPCQSWGVVWLCDLYSSGLGTYGKNCAHRGPVLGEGSRMCASVAACDWSALATAIAVAISVARDVQSIDYVRRCPFSGLLCPARVSTGQGQSTQCHATVQVHPVHAVAAAVWVSGRGYADGDL